MGHKILELYSGIGGMHCAWNDSGLQGEVVAAVDINTVANEVYHYNFSNTKLFTKNIQSITPKEIHQLDINTILMSPPCQPFSRNGKYLDDNDPRTSSFIYLLDIFNKLSKIEYILLENVKGFECSTVRNLFIDKLIECNFVYQEFLISPTSVGIPNSRLRYYCIARKNIDSWNFKRKNEIMQTLPIECGEPYSLQEIFESSVSEEYLVNEKQLKHAHIFDICYKESNRSCCFTKNYSRYIEGTGSVFTEATKEKVEECFKQANNSKVGSEDFVENVKELKLRFFTPKEVSSLMAFPKSYRFPETITIKQCYRLLGNSVNVKVISELLKVLFN